MPLQRHPPITIPLGGGVDDAQDARLLAGPRVADAKNVVLTKAGSYRKRRGMEVLASSSLPPEQEGLNSIHSLRGIPETYGRQGLYQFSTNKNKWARLPGGAPPVDYERVGVLHGTESITCYDVASDGLFTVETYMQDDAGSPVLFYRVRDLSSGAVVKPPTRIRINAQRPAVVWLTGATPIFLLFFLDGAALKYYTYNRATDTLTGPTTHFASDINSYDVDVTPTNTAGVLAVYRTSTSVATLYTLDSTFPSAGTLGNVASTITPFTDHGMRVFTQGSLAVMGGADDTGGNTLLTLALVNVGTPATPSIVGERGAALTIATTHTTQTGATRVQSRVGVAVGTTSTGDVFGALSCATPVAYTGPTAGGGSSDITPSECRWRVFNDNAGLTDLSELVVTKGLVVTHRAKRPTDHGLWFGAESYPWVRGSSDWSTGGVDGHVYRLHPGNTYPATLLLEIDETTPGVDKSTHLPTATPGAWPVPVGRINHDQAAAGQYGPENWSGHLVPTAPSGTKWLVPSTVAVSARVSGLERRVRPTDPADLYTTVVREVTGGALGALETVARPKQSALVAGELVLNQGTYTLQVDGTAAVESGLFPGTVELVDSTDPADAPPWSSSNTQLLRVVCVAKSASGVRHRSAPSNVFVSGYTGMQFYVVMPDVSLRRPNEGNEYYVEVYVPAAESVPLVDTDLFSTALGDKPGVGPYHLVAELPLTKQASGFFTFILPGTVAVPDYAQGTDAQQGAQLYTEGGVLEAQPPPPFATLVAGTNRLFGVNLENRDRVWFTKRTAPLVAPEWNDVLSTGAVGMADYTALAFLDDKLILFSADGVFWMGPPDHDDQGNGTPPQPEPVPSDTGCTSQQSVVNLPDGVLFAGKRGYYLLDRGLQVRYVGGPIEERLSGRAYSTSPLTINSAVLVAEDHEVRIATDQGYIFVYHYLADQWSWREGKYEHATMVGDRYHACTQKAGWAVTKDRDYDDTLGADPNDDPASFTVQNLLAITTGWLKLASLEGYGKIWRVMLLGDIPRLGGQVNSVGRIRISFAYDYDETFVDEHYWPSTSLFDSFQDVARLRLRLAPKNQKCEAIKIKIEELPLLADASPEPPITLDPSVGHVVSGITLEVGVIPGRQRNHDVNDQR